MRALVAPRFTDPTGFEVLDFPDLTITTSTHVLVKVHAASINGHDIIMASGKTKMLQVLPLPYPIGLDFSGIIVEVGDEVKEVAKGDEVYGFYFGGGAAATSLLIDTHKPHAISRVPKALSTIEAASLPAVAITAELGLKRADEFYQKDGGLKGKTVFIPGALSGVGSIALQIAKHRYGCHTLTAASTGKIPQIGNYLGEGVVDEAFDYTKSDVVKQIGKGKVDFVFDTTGLAGDYLPMMKHGGLCLSIARLPPRSALKNEDPDAPHQSRVACIGQNVMTGMDAGFRTWARTRYGVTYFYQKTDPVTEDLQTGSDLVDQGKIKTVVGKTASLEDIVEIRETCAGIAKGKGGIGKFVITMPEA